jgi:hypothetical protein
VPNNGISKTGFGKSSSQMLNFSSDTLFQTTMDSLEALQERANNAFAGLYTHLDEDDFNDLVDSLQYDHEGEFERFESSYNFSSLRTEYNRLLYSWIQKDSLDLTTHPAHKYPFSESMMALLNNDGAVKIDGNIYWFSEFGYAIIQNDDLAVLRKLISGDFTVLNSPNVIESAIETQKSNCKWHDTHIEQHTWSGNRRVIKTISHFSLPWFAQQRSRITAWRKAWFVWVPFWRNLRIGLHSEFRNQNCSSSTGWVSQLDNERRRHSRSRSHNYWGYGFFTKVQSGGNACGRYGYGGIERTWCL